MSHEYPSPLPKITTAELKALVDAFVDAELSDIPADRVSYKHFGSPEAARFSFTEAAYTVIAPTFDIIPQESFPDSGFSAQPGVYKPNF